MTREVFPVNTLSSQKAGQVPALRQAAHANEAV